MCPQQGGGNSRFLPPGVGQAGPHAPFCGCLALSEPMHIQPPLLPASVRRLTPTHQASVSLREMPDEKPARVHRQGPQPPGLCYYPSRETKSKRLETQIQEAGGWRLEGVGIPQKPIWLHQLPPTVLTVLNPIPFSKRALVTDNRRQPSWSNDSQPNNCLCRGDGAISQVVLP